MIEDKVNDVVLERLGSKLKTLLVDESKDDTVLMEEFHDIWAEMIELVDGSSNLELDTPKDEIVDVLELAVASKDLDSVKLEKLLELLCVSVSTSSDDLVSSSEETDIESDDPIVDTAAEIESLEVVIALDDDNALGFEASSDVLSVLIETSGSLSWILQELSVEGTGNISECDVMWLEDPDRLDLKLIPVDVSIEVELELDHMKLILDLSVSKYDDWRTWEDEVWNSLDDLADCMLENGLVEAQFDGEVEMVMDSLRLWDDELENSRIEDIVAWYGELDSDELMKLSDPGEELWELVKCIDIDEAVGCIEPHVELNMEDNPNDDLELCLLSVSSLEVWVDLWELELLELDSRSPDELWVELVPNSFEVEGTEPLRVSEETLDEVTPVPEAASEIVGVEMAEDE